MRPYQRLSAGWLLSIILTISARPAMCQEQQLPKGAVGEPYQARLGLRVTGVPPFRFTLESGALPSGLTLSSADGSITGIPDGGTSGQHSFVVIATDAEGHNTTQPFRLPISEQTATTNDQATAPESSQKESEGDLDACRAISVTNGLRAGSTNLQGHATPSKGSHDIGIQMDVVYGARNALQALAAFFKDRGYGAQIPVNLPTEIFRKTVSFKNPSSSRVASDGSFSLDLAEALDTGASIILTQFGCRRPAAAGEKARTQGAGSTPATVNTQQTAPADSANLAPNSPNTQSSQAYVVPGTIDWGRVKALFLLGAIFSNQDQQFSQSNVFASFSLDKAWGLPCNFGYAPTTNAGYVPFPGDACGYKPGFNTFFETRLTSIAVSSNTSTDSKSSQGSNAGSGGATQNSTPSLESLLTSKKTARFDLGGYLPFIITRWVHDDGPQGLFFAPLVKGGFDTLTDSTTVNAPQTTSTSATSSTSTTVSVPRLYNFFGAGARIGHYRLHNDRNEGPDRISHLDILLGKFSNFESLVSNCRSGVAPPCRSRLVRMSFEGLLQVPTPDSFPLYVGFNANVGQKAFGASHVVSGGDAGDDLRFFFGTQLNLGELVTKLKGSSGSSSSAPGSGGGS